MRPSLATAANDSSDDENYTLNELAARATECRQVQGLRSNVRPVHLHQHLRVTISFHHMTLYGTTRTQVRAALAVPMRTSLTSLRPPAPTTGTLSSTFPRMATVLRVAARRHPAVHLPSAATGSAHAVVAKLLVT